MTRSYEIAGLLLDCACMALEAVSGCPTRSCVVPGAEVSIENCCAGDHGGQLTVNIVQMYRSRNFPDPSNGRPRACEDPYLVVAYNVQIARCMPVGAGRTPPTCAQLSATAERVYDDMERIMNGLGCCLANPSIELTSLAGQRFPYLVGGMDAIGPEGGCVGAITQVLIGMGACLEC